MLFANPVSSKHGKIMDMLIKSKLITAAQFETKKHMAVMTLENWLVCGL